MNKTHEFWIWNIQIFLNDIRFYFQLKFLAIWKEKCQSRYTGWHCWHPINMPDQQSSGLTLVMQKWQSNGNCTIINSWNFL